MDSMESRLFSLTEPESTVGDLYSIMKEDPNILEKIDGLHFIDTPLHNTSAFGKINIAMELMILKPSLAKKLNADGFSPLHLAVEKNQVELALRLVKCDPSLIRFPGREGMTPLHLVAKKGGIYLLTKFLLACPDSIRDENVNGETALHITVINNNGEELKVLIGWMQRLRSADASSTEIHVLNSCDNQGNTALHFAAKTSNHEAVKQLLKCTLLNRNIVNNDNCTALDVLRKNETHRNKKTEKLIQDKGGKPFNAIINKVTPASDLLRTPVNFWIYCSTSMARYRSRMPENTRNALLVIAALIITATYTTAIQEDNLEDQTIIELLSNVTLGNNSMISVSDLMVDEKGKYIIVKTREFIQKKRDIVRGMVLLWGFNITAYALSVAWTFILLPAGREYIIWFVAIITTLTVSFGLSTYRKYIIYGSSTYDTEKSFYINIYLFVVFAIPLFLIIAYARWKLNKQKKVPGPKTEHISKGFKSWWTGCIC